MNRIFFIILLLLLSSLVLAETDKVMVLNFHYEDGKLSFLHKTIKDGDYPDRKIQPAQGKRIVLLSEDNGILYNAKFIVPDVIFVDQEDDDEISGAAIRLSENDFALVTPYFDNIATVNIYDENEDEILKVNIAHKLSKKRSFLLPITIAVVLIAMIVLFLLFRRKG